MGFLVKSTQNNQFVKNISIFKNEVLLGSDSKDAKSYKTKEEAKSIAHAACIIDGCQYDVEEYKD